MDIIHNVTLYYHRCRLLCIVQHRNVIEMSKDVVRFCKTF